MGENVMAQPDSAAGPVKVEGNLLNRARKGDTQALVTVFRNFIPENEKIFWTEYLGTHGWIMGRHSLGCLTDRRVADITIGHAGEVIYQDGFLEYANSSAVYQPSLMGLYLSVALALIVDVWLSLSAVTLLSQSYGTSSTIMLFGLLLFLGLGLLLVNAVVRGYYSVRKCGLVVWIKEGISVYVFTDHKRIQRAIAMLRMLTDLRDRRIGTLGHLG